MPRINKNTDIPHKINNKLDSFIFFAGHLASGRIKVWLIFLTGIYAGTHDSAWPSPPKMAVPLNIILCWDDSGIFSRNNSFFMHGGRFTGKHRFTMLKLWENSTWRQPPPVLPWALKHPGTTSFSGNITSSPSRRTGLLLRIIFQALKICSLGPLAPCR